MHVIFKQVTPLERNRFPMSIHRVYSVVVKVFLWLNILQSKKFPSNLNTSRRSFAWKFKTLLQFIFGYPQHRRKNRFYEFSFIKMEFCQQNNSIIYGIFVCTAPHYTNTAVIRRQNSLAMYYNLIYFLAYS